MRARGRIAIGTLLLVAAAAAPAAAHPFGPPPTALVSAAGRTVFVEWAGAVDDHLAVGEQLGLLPDGTSTAYLEAAVQVAPPRTAVEALGAAPELADYLLDHIVVRQDGTVCAGTVPPLDDFVIQGARVAYRCAAEIATVELEITMLTDSNQAYRTFAIAEDPATQPEQSVFTATAPVARWSFPSAAEVASQGPRRPLLWVAVAMVAAVAVAVAAGGAVVLRRGR